MKLAFIIGHNENGKGFYSEHLKKYEFDFYRSMTSKFSKIGEVFFHYPTISSYTQRCKDISNRIGKDYDLVVALHFNAFNGKDKGTECFYWHTNERTKELATWLTKEYSERFGSVNRGAKPYTSKNNRGAGEVYYPKIDAMLFEPFFGDNKEDCENFCESSFIELLCDLKNIK